MPSIMVCCWWACALLFCKPRAQDKYSYPAVRTHWGMASLVKPPKHRSCSKHLRWSIVLRFWLAGDHQAITWNLLRLDVVSMEPMQSTKLNITFLILRVDGAQRPYEHIFWHGSPYFAVITQVTWWCNDASHSSACVCNLWEKRQGCCAIEDIHPKLILISNLVKSRSSMTSDSVVQLFWNFAQSTDTAVLCA